jgi:hypothetical protein
MGAINEQKEKFWREQVTLAERREGSLESFCRERGLSPNTLGYWRRKLGTGEMKQVALPPFIPVTVDVAASRALPDPKWLAELIVHLSEAVR